MRKILEVAFALVLGTTAALAQISPTKVITVRTSCTGSCPQDGLFCLDKDDSKLYRCSSGSWVFLSDLSQSGSGSGDMTKSVYDTDTDSTVDAAEGLVRDVPAFDYVIGDEDGDGTYEAVTPDGYVSAYATDPGSLIDTVIDALATTGGTVLLRGDLQYDSVVPSFRSDIPQRLMVMGDQAKIVLSSLAPRAFDFERSTDNQTFQHIWIRGISVDANNIGGKHHVLLGTYADGSFSPGKYVNISDITVDNVRIFGVPTAQDTSVSFRGGIMLMVHQPDVTPLYANTIQGVRVTGYVQEGGDCAVMVGADASPDSNRSVIAEDVTLRDVWWTSNVADHNKFWQSTGYIIGKAATVRRALIANAYAEKPGDNCYEFNSVQGGTCVDCYCRDPFNVGWTLRNYNDSQINDDAQHIALVRPVLVYDSAMGCTDPDNVECVSQNGRMVDARAGDDDKGIYDLDIVGAMYYASGVGGSVISTDGAMHRIHIANSTFTSVDAVYDATTQSFPGFISLTPAAWDNERTDITLENVTVTWGASIANAGKQLDGAVVQIAPENANVKIDGLAIDVSLDGSTEANDRIDGLQLGTGWMDHDFDGTSDDVNAINGTIRGYVFAASSSNTGTDPTLYAIDAGDSTTLAVDDELWIAHVHADTMTTPALNVPASQTNIEVGQPRTRERLRLYRYNVGGASASANMLWADTFPEWIMTRPGKLKALRCMAYGAVPENGTDDGIRFQLRKNGVNQTALDVSLLPDGSDIAAYTVVADNICDSTTVCALSVGDRITVRYTFGADYGGSTLSLACVLEWAVSDINPEP